MRSILHPSFVILPLAAALPSAASLRGGSSGSTDQAEILPQHRQIDTSSSPHTRRTSTTPGVHGSDFHAINANMADLWEPYEPTKDTATFFMIPKSGTTTLEAYMSSCLALTMANDIGGDYASDTLEVVSFRDHPYVNVDTMQQDGLAHAADLKMGELAVADVMVTPYLHQSAEQLFSPEHKGRMFTLMRDPVERTVSLFYYLQTADWEPTYNPALKELSITQFLNDRHLFVDNFMTRQLVGKSGRHIELTREDLEAAKSLLSRKMLVGLSTEFQASLERFSSYFGWDKNEACLSRLTSGGGKNRNAHPTLEEGSGLWKQVTHVNRFDVALFEYAKRLFDQQALLFESSAQA